MELRTLFPQFPDDILVPSSLIFHRLFPDIPLEKWQKNGTWIEYWHDDVRIAFAPHRSYCSVYFQDRYAPILYREIGGTCPTGAVTINLPSDLDWDPEPIRSVLSKILGL